MSIKEVSGKIIAGQDTKPSSGPVSRVMQAADFIGWGLNYTYQSAGSLARTSVSHLPNAYLFSKKTFLQKIESLSSIEYQELLDFISSANPIFCKPTYKNLLQELVNHWEEVQTLVTTEKPSERLVNIVGTAQISPLVLFQALRQFSQVNLWKYLKKDVIAWPIENWDEAVAKHGLKEEKWTAQFYKDCKRSSYTVQFYLDGKLVEKKFLLDYKGDKLADLEVALQKLSVFKGTNGIPFAVQECLSQSMTIGYLTSPLWDSLNSPLGPPNSSERAFTIEEGNDSYFGLRIQETLKFPDGISFDYSYFFKISKESEKEWSAELVSISFVEPKITEISDVLFTTCQPSTSDSQVLNSLFSTLLYQLIGNLKAALICTDLEALGRIEMQIQKQWEKLSTQFDPEFLKTCHYSIQDLIQIFALADTAKTPEGKQILVNLSRQFAPEPETQG
jgi:hypothetical protein